MQVFRIQHSQWKYGINKNEKGLRTQKKIFYSKFENTLACLLGAQLGSNNENNGGQKSRDTLPLQNMTYCTSNFILCP